MRKHNEKGSILLMSAILLAAVTLIGTMIVAIFFRGYINIAREIRYQRERIEIQVEAQEFLVSLDEAELDAGILPDGLTFDVDTNTYTYTIEKHRFTMTVVLNEDLTIKKWKIEE